MATTTWTQKAGMDSTDEETLVSLLDSAAASAAQAAASEASAAISSSSALGSADSASASKAQAESFASLAEDYRDQSYTYSITASTGATTATTKAAEASASASAASTSASNAATSETNAATSASNASTSETNAATSASNASTSASNASTSETNAAASAAAAAATAASIGDLDSLSDVVIATPSTSQVLQYNGSNWVNATVASSGTVTSVDASVPTGFSISGNPIASSGTLAISFDTGYSLPTNVSQSNWNDAYAYAQVGHLENVVEDTTPQLGGTLDANGNSIDMGVNTITDTKVGQWDIAYGWGDHRYTTVVTATSVTASAWDHVHVTASSQTITLPASPSAGDIVAVTVENFTDTVIARNGNVIMDLSEDFTIDVANMGVTLIYTDATNGWRLL